jgi:hypothetical protein
VALPTLEQPYVCLPDGILPGRRSEVYRRNSPSDRSDRSTDVDAEALRQLPLRVVGSKMCQQIGDSLGSEDLAILTDLSNSGVS